MRLTALKGRAMKLPLRCLELVSRGFAISLSSHKQAGNSLKRIAKGGEDVASRR